MSRLIEADLAAAGQCDTREETPGLHTRRFAGNAGLLEPHHFHVEVVAHEIEFMKIVLVGRMHGAFRRWKLEDEPAAADVGIAEFQDVLEERFIGFGVLRIDDDMCAVDHENPLLSRPSTRSIELE